MLLMFKSSSYGSTRLLSLSVLNVVLCVNSSFFFFNDTATTEIYTLSLHDALPICSDNQKVEPAPLDLRIVLPLRHFVGRSEEHTSELQSPDHLVCRLLLEKKKIQIQTIPANLKPTTT